MKLRYHNFNRTPSCETEKEVFLYQYHLSRPAPKKKNFGEKEIIILNRICTAEEEHIKKFDRNSKKEISEKIKRVQKN